jgi:import receptor subunit TOM5
MVVSNCLGKNTRPRIRLKNFIDIANDCNYNHHNTTMYGAPQGQQAEEQKKLQEQYAYDTLKFAGVIAGALWVVPIVIHFVQKQLK